MADESYSSELDKRSSNVTIGNVDGGIRNSIIAARDVNIGRKITNFFLGSTEQQRAQRNRQAMLELVKNTWIKGVLEQSLHGGPMIGLGFEERAEAIERPWDMVVQMPGRLNRTLPPGTEIIDIFNEMNGALLILGEPGAGKTTTLLELARNTIACAEEDSSQPIPVVFNLSSWSEKQQLITLWLVDELNTKYYVPRRIAGTWIENNELLVLLDGLDEVKTRHREACAKAINDFRQEYGLTSLVVCSRTADYEALTTRLKLQGAVVLQPLSFQQLDLYLQLVGTELLEVRRILQRDAMLQELARTPLMLSVMALAYKGMSYERLTTLDSIEAWHKHLFRNYVDWMLERRGGYRSYSLEQSVHWLAWLAKKMYHRGQTLFLIEWMQPSWLATDRQLQAYLVVVKLFYSLLFGSVGGIIGALHGRPIVGIIGGGVACWWFGFASEPSRPIIPTELLRWSWRDVGKGLIHGLISGLVYGIAGWLIFVVVVGSILVLTDVPFPRLLDTLLAALIIPLLAGLAFGVSSGASIRFIETRTTPNQGIRKSVQNAAIMGLIGGVIGQLVASLPGALVGSLVFWMFFGGQAVVRHFSLRFILFLNGYVPWNYACFLDHATNCILLRKAGGGYIFIHRLLMEYFASLKPE